MDSIQASRLLNRLRPTSALPTTFWQRGSERTLRPAVYPFREPREGEAPPSSRAQHISTPLPYHALVAALEVVGDGLPLRRRTITCGAQLRLVHGPTSGSAGSFFSLLNSREACSGALARGRALSLPRPCRLADVTPAVCTLGADNRAHDLAVQMRQHLQSFLTGSVAALAFGYYRVHQDVWYAAEAVQQRR